MSEGILNVKLKEARGEKEIEKCLPLLWHDYWGYDNRYRYGYSVQTRKDEGPPGIGRVSWWVFVSVLDTLTPSVLGVQASPGARGAQGISICIKEAQVTPRENSLTTTPTFTHPELPHLWP